MSNDVIIDTFCSQVEIPHFPCHWIADYVICDDINKYLNRDNNEANVVVGWMKYAYNASSIGNYVDIYTADNTTYIFSQKIKITNYSLLTSKVSVYKY